MELKEQKYVVTLDETRNLTRAAKKLHISQPALSLYIKSLETNFGEPLFTRDNRKIVPTYFGELYIAKAREILEIGNQFKAEYLSLKNGVKGKVIFGLTFWQSPVVLPAILPEFRKLYPDIAVDVHEGADEDDLLEMLDDHSIDFAIVDGLYPEYEQTILTQDKVILLISGKSEFAQKHQDVPDGQIKPEDLNGLLFLLHCPFADSGNPAADLKKSFGITTSQVMALKSMESILLLVKQNFGATLVTEKQLGNYDLSKIKAFAIEDPAYIKTTYTTTLKGEKTSDYSETLMRLIHSKLSLEKGK